MESEQKTKVDEQKLKQSSQTREDDEEGEEGVMETEVEENITEIVVIQEKNKEQAEEKEDDSVENVETSIAVEELNDSNEAEVSLSTIDISAIDSEKADDSEDSTKRRIRSTEKRAIQTTVVETRQKSKRPRRHISTVTSYTDYDAPGKSPGPSTPKSVKSSPSIVSGDKPFYTKGEVLAVRNEDGGFYLCSVPNNIFTVSKAFKVQWFDKCEEPNIYKRSYFDYITANAVLYSGLSLKRTETGGKFILSEPQQTKVKHRLEKSLQGVEEISSDSEEEKSKTSGSGKSKKKKTLKQAAKQIRNEPALMEPDIVMEISEDPKEITEVIIKTTPASSSRKKAQPKKPQSQRLGKISVGAGKKRYSGGPASPKLQLASPKQEVDAGSSGALTVAKPRKQHFVSGSKVGGSEIVQYMYNPDATESGNYIRNEQLTPNQEIQVAEKDPSFELRSNAEPQIPADKRAIRAVILQDVELLESLFRLKPGVQYLRQYRSIDVLMTAFHYALINGNQSVLQSLMHEMTRSAEPTSAKEIPAVLKDGPDLENGFKGEHLSAMDISKGLKEGNFAFLKDWQMGCPTDPTTANELASFACAKGCSRDTAQLLMDMYPKTKDGSMTNFLMQNIWKAIEMGHQDLAHFLVHEARRVAITSAHGSPGMQLGHEFNELHEIALSAKDMLPHFNMKEAKKRVTANNWIQPVHCAAINPDTSYLKKLYQVSRECITAADSRGRRPIHYAAASESSHTLEFLSTRVNVEEQDQMGLTPLMVAAACGRHKNVQVILKLAAKSQILHVENVVERPDRNNFTAVHHAAQNGHMMVISMLAKYGADLNRPVSISKARATPLMLGSAQGHLQTCITLVTCGASIEARDKLQRTALIHSAMNGHLNVMSYLLHKGADPNVSDSSSNTAIHYAAGYGWFHCVKLLLEANANPDVYNDRKMPPIGVAFLKNHRDIVSLLYEHSSNIHFKDDRGRTLLSRLVADENLTWPLVDHISYLLDCYKPEVNEKDIQGMGPLHHLASNTVRDTKRDIESERQAVSLFLANLLLERGAELNMADFRGRLPLYFAVDDMNVALVELMVRKGTHCPRSVNATSDNILHMLARNWQHGNMADIVLGLVDKSPQNVQELASRRNKFGFTPLLLLTKTIAELTGAQKSIVQESLLLDTDDSEAKKLQKDLEDVACPLLEAFVLAAKSDVSLIVGRARRSNKNVNDDGKTCAHYLSRAIADKECKVLSCLLRHKPRLDVLDSVGTSPLTMAIIHRNCRAVQLLLDAGATPNFCSGNKKQKYPMAPLILATSRHGPGERSLLPAIRAILRKIPDISAVPADPRNGRTALMCAVEKEEEMDLVNALLEKQASLTDKDWSGCSPLHLAVNASGPNSALFDIPDLLIEKGASLTALDNDGRIPLHYAYLKIAKDDSHKYNDPIELTNLLTSGMNADEVDTADGVGQTPLHAAAMQGAMICCMHLVERGANINRQDVNGNSALSLAVNSGHNSTAVMLIQKGANVNTNVITIPEVTSDAVAGNQQKKWQLRSSTVPPQKPTCEPLFKVVVEKGWQGVTYVMLDRLEACGVKYAAAVDAAMRAHKYQVVLSLLRKQRDSQKLCEKNEQKQNLLHVLAINKPDNTDVQIKVAQLLMERGVPSYVKDEFECTPLHYAAFTKNITLIKFLLEKNPQSFRSLITLEDGRGRNAFAALLWSPIINDDVTTQILKLFLEHDNGSGAINRTCKFPVTKSTLRDYSVTEYFNNIDVDVVTTTALIRAIQCKAHKVLDLLLEYSVDINLQVIGLSNQTPLMVAVQENDEYVVRKMLEHKTPVLLSTIDDNGLTVLHHSTKPLTYGCWENVCILRLLVEHGVPLEVRDNSGHLALDYALMEGSGKMSDELQVVMDVPQHEWTKPTMITAETSDEIEWRGPKPEYEVDAVTILDRIREDEMENEGLKTQPQPDVLSGLRETGEIVVDPTVNRHCDVFLTSVDVQQGRSVQYNFFRIQVIHQKGRNLYLFFTRWGLIGERGSWQTSPFNTPGNAIKEFAKYFKLKTGNEWRNVNNFKPQTRKYHLVSAEVQQKRGVADLEFDLHSDIDSQLTEDVQLAYKDLISVESMKEALKDSTSVDPDIMPFGRLEKDRLNLSVDILSEIKELIASNDDLKLEDPQDQIRLQRSLEKIQQLSTEYFRLLPPKGGLFDRVRSIGDVTTLNKLMKETQRLIELEFANKVLLGAQYRINEMNPLDYVYRSVGCNMTVMKPQSDEAQYLLQYFYNSMPASSTVECIFRLCRPAEANALVSTGLGNFRMLWHGTNILNLMSILHEGLQPYEPPTTVPLMQFGKGIYLSDMASRAMQECKKWAGEKKYMLVCQTALGHLKEIRETTTGVELEVANSVVAVGKNIPKPGNELILPEGGAVPLGEKIKNPNMNGVTNAYNEYVVYSSEQVCLRYLVRFSDNTSSKDSPQKSK